MRFTKPATGRHSGGTGRSAKGPERGSARRWARISAASTAFVVMLLPAAASAATGAPVTFNGTIAVSSEPCGGGPPSCITNTGSWTASGAVTGSFAVSEQTWFGGGNSLTVHYVGTLTPLTGASGTITIDVQAKFTGFSAPYEEVRGVWVITSGTGAYAGLHGTGDYTATVNVSTQPKIVTESLTGAAETS